MDKKYHHGSNAVYIGHSQPHIHIFHYCFEGCTIATRRFLLCFRRQLGTVGVEEVNKNKSVTDDDEDGSDRPSRGVAWIAALASSVVISLLSLGGVILIPFQRRAFRDLVMPPATSVIIFGRVIDWRCIVAFNSRVPGTRRRGRGVPQLCMDQCHGHCWGRGFCRFGAPH